jgi:hypothetical protein
VFCAESIWSRWAEFGRAGRKLWACWSVPLHQPEQWAFSIGHCFSSGEISTNACQTSSFFRLLSGARRAFLEPQTLFGTTFAFNNGLALMCEKSACRTRGQPYREAAMPTPVLDVHPKSTNKGCPVAHRTSPTVGEMVRQAWQLNKKDVECVFFLPDYVKRAESCCPSR